MTTAHAIQQALDTIEEQSPPHDVLTAARYCASLMALGIKPPQDLTRFVSVWIGRQQAQDRYGK